MVKKKKNMIMKLLTDPLHYIGWIITTGAVVGLFYLIGLSLYNPWYNVVYAFLTIMVVDIIKHLVKLQ